jgi:hypothetical protein
MATEVNVIDDAGLKAARAGPDHSWFGWSALPARPPLRWPNGARVAVSVVLNLGAVEWERDLEFPIPPLGGRGVARYPDFPRMSHREFGHRVGAFRLLEILQDVRITPAVAIDVLTAEHYRPLLKHLHRAAGEFVAAGLSASRPITSSMTDDEEAHYIGSTLDRLEASLGSRPTGWLSPEGSESSQTPRLLAEAGLSYVADWSNDEQPYPMDGAGGRLWAYPLSWELSDVSAVHLRDLAPSAYATTLVEAFEVMCDDGETSGRVLGLHLHPWLCGQAFRASAIAEALGSISGHPSSWLATPAEIVNWCRTGGQPA